MNLRDQILKAEDLGRETVACPEWGCDVVVRGLTGEERDALEAESADLRDAHPDMAGAGRLNLRARVVARAACDGEGRQIFTLEDAEALGRKSAKVLDRLFEVADRLSSVTVAEVASLQGKSEAAPSGSSGSGSASA